MTFAEMLNPTLEVALQLAAAAASRKYAATALHNLVIETKERKAENGRPAHNVLEAEARNGFHGACSNGRLYTALEIHPVTLLALAQQALAAKAPVVRLVQYFDAPGGAKKAAQPADGDDIPL